MATPTSPSGAASRLLLGLLAAVTVAACGCRGNGPAGNGAGGREGEAGASDQAWAHFMAGADYEQEGDWARAAAHYEMARAEDPASARILTRLGFCHLQAGNPEAALAALARSARLRPDDLETHRLLALLHTDALQLDAAVKHWSRVIELEPTREPAYRALYEVYKHKGEPEEAMRVLGQLARNSANPQAIHIEMAQLYASEKQYSQALLHYMLVKTQYPEYQLNSYRLVVCYKNLGQIGNAIREMRALLAGDPDNPGWLTELASLYVANGQAEEAATLLNRIISQAADPLSPHVVDAYLKLADLRLVADQSFSAVAILREALRRGCKHYRIHEKLGDVQATRRRRAAAIQSYRAALALSPRSDAAELIQAKLDKLQEE